MATAWEAVRMDEATFRGRGAPRAPPREGSVMPPRSLRTPWGWSPGETPLPEGRRQHLEGGRELPRHRRDGVQPLLSALGGPGRGGRVWPLVTFIWAFSGERGRRPEGAGTARRREEPQAFPGSD